MWWWFQEEAKGEDSTAEVETTTVEESKEKLNIGSEEKKDEKEEKQIESEEDKRSGSEVRWPIRITSFFLAVLLPAEYGKTGQEQAASENKSFFAGVWSQNTFFLKSEKRKQGIDRPDERVSEERLSLDGLHQNRRPINKEQGLAVL